ncbi:MAG1360 family OppF-related protein [Mycoplasmopsis pullorum]|uniref:MAG1360 family OppF-related protein n=1 Tax=Mycoplasmopsis pullorum TaxID=48003 RepID=UPI001119E364|nr:hypothetical protein [Mycoplasmopsis pullorum]TNK89146.1 hypothetical protein C4M89_00470 [Mycoplasmopsis pullorum]
MNKQRIFAVENLFEPLNKKNGSSFFNIPLLEIYSNERSAIVIDQESTFFDLENFWYKFLYNETASYVLNEFKSKNRSYNVIYGKNDTFNEIFTFSLEELLEKNFDIPIYQIWDYAYNSKIDNSEISNLKNILNKYDIEFKTKILSILDKSSKNIIKINDKINDDLLILSNDLSSRWFSLKDEEFQSRLDKIKDLLNEFKNENLTFFFKFYYEMFQIYNNFKEEYEQQQKNEADSDESIFDIEKKLKFLKQYNSSSNNIIQQKLLIRDLKFENTFFKNQLKDIIKRNKKYKKYIIYKIKNNIKTNKRKIQLLTSNTKEYLYLYKKIAVKKKSLSFWKYYVNKAKYLDTNELSNIVKAIINEEEFFILNNLSTISELSGFWDKWKIKARIFNNYNFNFNSYIENSRNKKIFLNQEAQKRADMIKEIEKIKFKNKLDLSKQLEQQKFNDFIKLHKAEYRWNKQSRDKLFKTTILKSAPKVKRFEKNLKKQIRSIEATVKVIADVVDKKSKVSNKINELNQFVNTNLNSFESFSKWPLVSSFIYELISFLSNKFLFSNQFALSFLAIQKMILAMSFVSINFSSYLKSYFENEIDDVIKLKLIKILITQPKLAFVKDDESVITNQIRKDFLKILNIICSNNKIPFVFITKNFELAKNNFDSLTIFYKNNLIESGKTIEILNKPINPYTQELVHKHTNKSFSEFWPWIYNDVFFLKETNTHYVCSSQANFLKWNRVNMLESEFENSNSNELKSEILEDVDKYFKPINENKEQQMFFKWQNNIYIGSDLFKLTPKDKQSKTSLVTELENAPSDSSEFQFNDELIF